MFSTLEKRTFKLHIGMSSKLEACGPVGVVDGLPVAVRDKSPSVVVPLLTGVVVVGVLVLPTMLVQTPLHNWCHCKSVYV